MQSYITVCAHFVTSYQSIIPVKMWQNEKMSVSGNITVQSQEPFRVKFVYLLHEFYFYILIFQQFIFLYTLHASEKWLLSIVYNFCNPKTCFHQALLILIICWVKGILIYTWESDYFI